MNMLCRIYNYKRFRALLAISDYQQAVHRLIYTTSGHCNNRNVRNKYDFNKKFSEKNYSEALPPFDSIIKPLTVNPKKVNDSVGEEICGKLIKEKVRRVMLSFQMAPEMKRMAQEVKISPSMFVKVCTSFRSYCTKENSLPTELHIKLYDLCNETGNISDLFPYFYTHAKEMYPHLIWMDDLKKNSDLRDPINWFPQARSLQRRIIYHAGPTNSGKTYSALEALKNANSGIYCGPLKLLAVEVAEKINSIDKKCDLITGDDKSYINEDLSASSHMACTIEMANMTKEFDVAVIDEIQLISDSDRGWAWTRALLGICAKEIHICGDPTAIDLIEEMCLNTGDVFELKKYDRLTPLKFLNKSLDDLKHVQPGDCIVCFNKKNIFQVTEELRLLKKQFSVIYGSLPPSVKLAEARRFNDPQDPCKILVATDAIGMGLNLNIRRMVFYNLMKVITKDTQKSNEDISLNDSLLGLISTSQALQISGRAGRFNTVYPEGYVTTLNKEDLTDLLDIVKQPLESLSKAGLHPTSEQIEQFSNFLPKYTMSQLLDIFVSICEIDSSKYFLCNYENIMYLASLVDHVPLKMSERYTFACAPVSKGNTMLISSFVKFVRLYSSSEPIGADEVMKIIDWPVKEARSTEQLKHLETIFDILDLYLWLGYRFSSMFTSMEEVKDMRSELNNLIDKGLKLVTKGSKGKALNNRKVSTTRTSIRQSTTNEVDNNGNSLNSEEARIIFEKSVDEINQQLDENFRIKYSKPGVLIKDEEKREVNKEGEVVEEEKSCVTNIVEDMYETNESIFEDWSQESPYAIDVANKNEQLGKNMFDECSSFEGDESLNAKQLSRLIQEIPLKEKDRLKLVTAPISPKKKFLLWVYYEIVSRFSSGTPISVDDFVEIVKWPRNNSANSVVELLELEEAYDACNLYKWLNQQYPSMFPANASKLRPIMNDIRGTLIRVLDSVNVNENENVNEIFRMKSRFELELEDIFFNPEEQPKAKSILKGESETQKTVSSSLLNVLSSKANEIQQKSGFNNNQIVKIYTKSVYTESSSDEVPVEKDECLLRMLNKTDRNDPTYTQELEIIVKHMMKKNLLKEKSFKRILKRSKESKPSDEFNE